MNHAIESLYQEIGAKAVDLAEGTTERVLLYAEVEDGVIALSCYFVDQTGKVKLRFAQPDLEDDVEELWRSWKAVPGNQEWRGMTFLIEGGDFKIGFQYPEAFADDEALHHRRARFVKMTFGDVKVDNPF